MGEAPLAPCRSIFAPAISASWDYFADRDAKNSGLQIFSYRSLMIPARTRKILLRAVFRKPRAAADKSDADGKRARGIAVGEREWDA